MAFLSLKAQNSHYEIQYFSTEHGLSSRLINCVLEDSKGLIWVGTQSGLNRFDGEEFKIYDKNNNGLSNNSISYLLEDINGNIWMGSVLNLIQRESSFSIFNPNTEQAIDFDLKFPNAPFHVKDIVNISSKNRVIWMALRTGEIYIYNGVFQLITKINVTKQFFFNPVEEDEGMWYADEKQLIHINEKGKTIRKISSPNVESLLLDSTGFSPIVREFSKSKDGYYLARFYSFYEAEKTFKLTLNEHDEQWEEIDFFNIKKGINRFLKIESPEGKEQLWLVGANMLQYHDSTGELVNDFSKQIQKERTVFSCSDIHVSPNQNIWISTNIGLILITAKPKLFQTYLTNQNTSIRGINEINDQNLFVVTYDGFYLLDKKSGKKTKLKQYSFFRYGLGLTRLAQQFFIGTHSTDILIYDLRTQKFSSQGVRNLPFGFESRFVFQDRFQGMWVAGNMGARKYIPEISKFDFPPQADSTHVLYLDETNFIYENEKGLWMCSDNGLFLINHEGKILKHIQELNSFQINYLHESQNGDFWMTTKGRGLLKWNSITRHLQHWTTDDGLSHNQVYSVHEDQLGNLWIPSNNGLMRIDSKDFSLHTFLPKDGLPNKEFNTFARFESPDGKIYLGTVDGMVSFDPMNFEFLDKKNSKLILTSFVETKSSGEKNRIINKFEKEKEIIFGNDTKTIELEVALLDFQNSFQSKYAYKIDGYDSDWNKLESNFLKINRLPYGDYQLKIRGQGSYKEWSKNELVIPICILKPFYLKSWFFVVASILLCFLIYRMIRWRIYFLEKEKLVLEKTVAERTKELAKKTEKLSRLNQLKDEFFAIIAHDLRAPVISFQNLSKKLKYLNENGNPGDVNMMLQMVDDAAENLNVLLDNLLNWALVQKGIFPYNPTVLNLKELSDEAVQLFEPMAEVKQIELQQDISKTVTINADKDAMSMILRNLVSNALKFSCAGDLVKISANRKNGNVLLCIQDSGVGIAPHMTSRLFELNDEKVTRGTNGEKGSGLGLVLCKELIEMNHGNIKVESELGKGTLISISLPVN